MVCAKQCGRWRRSRTPTPTRWWRNGGGGRRSSPRGPTSGRNSWPTRGAPPSCGRRANMVPVFEAAPTTDAWLALRDRQAPPSSTFLDATRQIVEEYGLFHWELAFPDVFARGGFDVVLGQPPVGARSNSRNRSSLPSASRPSRMRGTPPNERSSSRRFQPRTRFSGRSGPGQHASHRDRAISYGNPDATRFAGRATSTPMRCLRNTIGEC